MFPLIFNNIGGEKNLDDRVKATQVQEVLTMLSFYKIMKSARGRMVILTLGAFLCAVPAIAQRAEKQTSIEQSTLELLLTRIDQLEARVKQLEAERPPTKGTEPAPGAEAVSVPVTNTGEHGPANDPAQTLAPVQTAMVQSPPPPSPTKRTSSPQSPTGQGPSPQEAEQAQSDNVMMERMDVSRTLLRIRGFGDINLHGDTQKGDTTSFSLGQLDLFVTSDVSDRFKFLSEIVFESSADDIYGTIIGSQNSLGVDIERYLMQYSHNDYFNISAGRGHTAIGYYNTAYHHSSWLQTTTGRPFIFAFEDEGGILPIHMVGASVSGQVPSGSLGLHYVAEVGNGRASRTPLTEEPVQNEVDDQNRKAFNLALFSRPEAVHGLQTGFSFYRDLLAPVNSPKIGESIFAAHAVLIRPKYEWLNEALLDRHTVTGTSQSFNTPAFYSQVSKQFGAYRPYFRYQYVNVSNNEPIFPDVQLRHGPSAGLRFDASESVALKFQYDYTFLRSQPGVNSLALQLGFTF
jgi:hypothetical protein